MRAAALLLLAATCLSCHRSSPISAPVPAVSAPPSFVSAFVAKVTGPEGEFRFRGLLALRGGDSIRAEIAAPTVSSPLILVASPRGVLAVLSARAVFFRGSVEEPILMKITGVPIQPSDLARLLGTEEDTSSASCLTERRRFRPVEGGRLVPTRLHLLCGDASLSLRLADPQSLPGGSQVDPFSLAPPPWPAAEADLQGFIEVLRGSLRGDG